STYGVMGLEVIDTDGDGRAEIIAGIGMNASSGPMFNYSATGTNGLFTGWTAKGGTVGPPYYATSYGVAVGDFAGNGTQQAAVIMSGSPNYSNLQAFAVFSGSGLGTKTAFSSNGNMAKACAT